MKKVLICLLVFTTVFIFFTDKLKENDSTSKNGSVEISLSDSYHHAYENAGAFSYDLYTPINFRRQKAMWFTYMDYAEILLDKSEVEFTEEIKRRFLNASMMGINTVYVQVRAFGDAYYESEIFPKGKYCGNIDFDPLEIMVSQAHAFGLSFHAWINPLRLMTEGELDLNGECIFARWYCDESPYVRKIDNRLYLNPAYPEVQELIAQGAGEIVEKYNVDGVHIDDYFYPTEDASFDSEEFRLSGADNLSDWRRENINKLVSGMYKAIKNVNSEVLFGISPQGNISADYNNQYADVEKWMNESGYCDYIVPQVYYGYKNSECPFEEIVFQWEALVSDKVKLVIGVCTYKNGAEDKWAGTGRTEWLEDHSITSRQIRDCISCENVSGVAVYSYSSTFEDDISSDIMAMGQIQQIREDLEKYK